MENVIGTNCCALAQMVAGNGFTMAVLKEKISNCIKSGYRAIFVITLPHEEKLVERLVKLGFEAITTFERRHEYEQVPLTMWLRKV
jgi:citrate lyase synthetase